MKAKRILSAIVIMTSAVCANAGMQSFNVTPEWKAKIAALAPDTPTVAVKAPRKALLFSRMTGYQHWVTPHTAAVITILGQKSGAYDVVASDDVNMFTPANLKPFDIVILNNNCSKRSKRNLFFDVTGDETKAAMLEQSLISHIARGNGLVLMHGAITMQNKSPAFSAMVGGSFDFHPRQQEVTCTLVDPDHPLVEPFAGKAFVHVDEPYLFKNAYKDKRFRPLLEMDTATLDCGKRTKAVRSDKRYVAWIKPHEKGRVFYCSPSHNAQSFENTELLQFILNGIQYAAGDLECNDSPMKPKKENPQ